MEKNTLSDILTTSRKHNLRDDITGFLAYRSGYFLQLLEGAEDKVNECYQRIIQDHRHRNIILQGTAVIEKRIMPDWSMGLVETKDQDKSMQDILTIFDLAHSQQTYSSSRPLEAMLRLFANNATII